MSGNCARLAPAKFGFAWGLMWGLGVLLMGWASWLWSYGDGFVKLFANCYVGYAPTFLGGLIGGLWGFIDFFIFTWLVALVYNACCKACPKTSGESSV